MDFKKQKAVLTRIKKAYDFVEANKNNIKAIEEAEKRFKDSVIPECLEVGIEEYFAWALFYFGKEFLVEEFSNR